MTTEKWFLLCLSLLAICPALGSIDELAPLVPYMSENLYFSLFKEKNNSVVKDIPGNRPLNAEDIENFRRFELWSVNSFWPFGYHDNDILLKSCTSIRYIYRGALDYIHRYYGIRTLYVDNIEYDIGYITHQIVFRYQIMIETYHIVIKKFVNRPDERALPISPFFYFYTNMIEQSQVIINLVNMLEEAEAKYKGLTNIHWVDPTTRAPRKTTKSATESAENDTTIFGHTTTPSTTTANPMESAKAYEMQRILAAKKRKKEMKKIRKNINKGHDVQLTKPTYAWVKKKNHVWQLDYGWSIETW